MSDLESDERLSSVERLDNPAILVSELWGGETALNAAWREAFVKLAGTLSMVRTAAVPLTLHIQFQVAGNVWKPDWEGVRLGSYSSAKDLLMAQATLPENFEANRYALLVSRVLDVLDLTDSWLAKKKRPGNSDAARALMAPYLFVPRFQ